MEKNKIKVEQKNDCYKNWDELINYANSGGQGTDRYKESLDFNYDNQKNTLEIRIDISNTTVKNEITTDQKDKLRKNSDFSYRDIDAYTLKLLAYAKLNKLYDQNSSLNVKFNLKINQKKDRKHIESLRRRLSYFNNFNFEEFFLVVNNESLELDSRSKLFAPGKEKPKLKFSVSTEKVKESTSEEAGLEKQLQDFIVFGDQNRIENDQRLNNVKNRLKLLGEDFWCSKDVAERYLIKEFTVSDDNNILPEYKLDLLTVNASGANNSSNKLSIIELKCVKDLAILSQVLDYAIHFQKHKKNYQENNLKDIKNKYEYNDLYSELKVSNKSKFIAYIAANIFHQDLDKIKDFYIPQNKENIGFEIKQIHLGYTENLF